MATTSPSDSVGYNDEDKSARRVREIIDEETRRSEDRRPPDTIWKAIASKGSFSNVESLLILNATTESLVALRDGNLFVSALQERSWRLQAIYAVMQAELGNFATGFIKHVMDEWILINPLLLGYGTELKRILGVLNGDDQ